MRIRSNRSLSVPLPSPAMIVAVIALLVALSGGAYAATVISGQNIKKSTITGKQIKNRSLTGSDIKKHSIHKNDLASDALAAGAPGAPGKDGASVLNSTVPSGKTIRGLWDIDATNNTSQSEMYYSTGTFQIPTTQVLSSSAVNFAASAGSDAGDDDATCTGSSNAPTAPPGKVCIYISDGEIYESAAHTMLGNALTDTAPTYGFEISVSLPTGSTVSYDGAWAYTAP